MPDQFNFRSGGFLTYNPQWDSHYWLPYGGGASVELPQGTQFPQGLQPYVLDENGLQGMRHAGYDWSSPSKRNSWDWNGNIQHMQGYYAPQYEPGSGEDMYESPFNLWGPQNQAPAPAPPAQPVAQHPAPQAAQPEPEISPRRAAVRRALAVPEDQRLARLEELDNQALREDRERWLARMNPQQRERVLAEEEAGRTRRAAERRSTPEEIEQQSRAMVDRLLSPLDRLREWGETPDDLPLPETASVPENASPEEAREIEEHNNRLALNAQQTQENPGRNEADPWGMASLSPRQREAEEAVDDPLFEYNEPFEKRHHDWDWNNIGDSIKNKWSDFKHNAKGAMSGVTPGELANMARREYSRYKMLGGLSPSGGILSRLGGYLAKRGALGAAEEVYNRGGSLTDNPLTHGVGDAFQSFIKTGIGKSNARVVRNALGGAAGGVEKLAHNLFPTANDFWTAQNSGDIGSAVGSIINKKRLGRFGAMGLQALYDTLQRNQESERRNLLRQRRASNPNYRIPRRDDFRDNDPLVQHVFRDWDENREEYA
jgi:hypothetical protein